MKLSKKLMLFEEFTQTGTEVGTEVAVDTTTQTSLPTDSVRTDIVSDVDSIISKLEDLARGIGQEDETNESALITEAEGAVGAMMSAELYMIPLIAAGVVGGAAVGITVLINKAIRRAKIRKNFSKNVTKPKLKAAKMEIAMDNLTEAEAAVTKPAPVKKNKPATAANKKKAARKSKVDQYKQKIENLKKSAEDYATALSSKYPKDKDIIAALNAEANMQVAKLLLDSGTLTPSEQKRYEQQYQNAVDLDAKYAEDAEKEMEEGKKAKEGASPKKQEEIEQHTETVAEEIPEKNKEGSRSKEGEEDSNPTKKNSKEDQLQRIDDLIKKEEEKPEFTKKSEEIKTKIGEYEEAIKDLESKKDKSSKDKIGMLQAAIASEKKKLEALDGENPKLKKLKDLRKKVEMKESWNEYDFDVMIFETQISTLELEYELV